MIDYNSNLTVDVKGNLSSRLNFDAVGQFASALSIPYVNPEAQRIPITPRAQNQERKGLINLRPSLQAGWQASSWPADLLADHNIEPSSHTEATPAGDIRIICTSGPQRSTANGRRIRTLI